MKRIAIFITSFLVSISLVSCGNSKDYDTVAKQPENAFKASGNSRMLVAYYSMPEGIDSSDHDALAGASMVIDSEKIMGNTEYMALLIQQETGADIMRIETVEELPLDHKKLVNEAKDQQNADARPLLKEYIESTDAYDVILLGYLNWWADLPMPVYSFLETNDLKGKTIIPFSSHGGSGLSDTVNTIKKLQPDANVSDNALSVSRGDVADAKDEVTSWVQGLGITANKST